MRNDLLSCYLFFSGGFFVTFHFSPRYTFGRSDWIQVAQINLPPITEKLSAWLRHFEQIGVTSGSGGAGGGVYKGVS